MRLQQRFSEQMRTIYRVIEDRRLALDEEFMQVALRQLKLEDVQKAAELLVRADLHLDQVDLTQLKLGELVVIGVVAMVFSPVPARSKLEGVIERGRGQRGTFADAKSDERVAARDPLAMMQTLASSLKLEDMDGLNPGRKKTPWS
ncbi:hypothetical protein D3C86_1750390 [compost metagenome]